jgi:hypothetical protein
MLGKLIYRGICGQTALKLKPHQIPLIAPSARPVMAKYHISQADLLSQFAKKIISKEDALQFAQKLPKPTKPAEGIKVPMFTTNKKLLGLPSYIDIPVLPIGSENPKIQVPNQYAKDTYDLTSAQAFINRLETAKLIKKGDININDFLIKAYAYSLLKNRHLNIFRNGSKYSQLKSVGIAIPLKKGEVTQWRTIEAAETKGLQWIHNEIANLELTPLPGICSSAFYLPLPGVCSITQFVRYNMSLSISFGEAYKEVEQVGDKLVVVPKINTCLASNAGIIEEGEGAKLLSTMAEVMRDVSLLHL